MTANDFFKFCAMGYKSMGYEGCELSPKEQYKKHADGRDDGLLELEADSPEAFNLWLNKKDGWLGHPWEVCRGGNSTHISLYVNNDENGYYLIDETFFREDVDYLWPIPQTERDVNKNLTQNYGY